MNAATRFLLYSLRIVGLDPFLQNRTSTCLTVLSASITLVILVPYINEILFHFNGIETIKNLQYMAAPVQGLSIICMLIFKRQTIFDLINASQTLWPESVFGAELKNNVKQIKKKTFALVVAIYVITLNEACLILFLYGKEGKLVLLGYRQCNKTLCYKLQFLLHVIYANFVLIPVVCSYICFFCVLISEVLCQLDILHNILTNFAATENPEQQLKDIIEQHVHLLRLIRLINKMYSLSLLVGFVWYPTVIIFNLYTFTLEGMPLSMTTILNILPPVVISLITLFIFCIAGTLIDIQFDMVCNAVYEIQWLEAAAEGHQIGTDVLILLQAMQLAPELTIAFTYPLNLNTYARVMNFCYSTYTFILGLTY